ncbi:MAG: damage-inducible protein DinB [Planctomycetes bacterium]|nr:damage-inducible protein DinB [Planctomycetota bacterium]
MDPVFLIDSYATERVKTLSVWSQFRDADLELRIEPRARTPHEHFVHQCVSEDNWMRTMLGIESGLPALPARETRLEFLRHYAAASETRLASLRARDGGWFDGSASFFGVERSRAWILVRRLTHTAHHRGQLTLLLRSLGRALYSTYGPTADTGGLFQNGACVVYRHANVEELLEAEAEGGTWPALPGPGTKPVTERRS